MSRRAKTQPAFQVKPPRNEGEEAAGGRPRNYGWREQDGRKLKSWSLHPSVEAYIAMTVQKTHRFENGEDFTYSDMVKEALDDWFEKHHEQRHFGTARRAAPPKED